MFTSESLKVIRNDLSENLLQKIDCPIHQNVCD